MFLLAMILDVEVGNVWMLKQNSLLFHVMWCLMRFHHIMLLKIWGVMLCLLSHSLMVLFPEKEGETTCYLHH